MRTFVFIFSIFIIFSLVNFSISIKVCSSWLDYWKYFGNNTCRENLDGEDEFAGIVSRWGKQVETYEVMTYDGYLITLFRIVPNNKMAPPVLLLPSDFMNALALVNRGPKSLAYPFVEAGYDVWIINFRGTKYSKGHIGLKSTNIDFWKFSFHEFGVYDIPAALNTIHGINNQKILLIGYDVSTSAAFVYATEFAEDAAETLSGMVSLSPLTVPNNANFFLKLQYWLAPFTLTPLIDFLYHGEFSSQMRSLRATFLCKKGIWIQRLCDAGFQLFSGLDLGQQDPETLSIIVAQNKDSESTMNIVHFSQILRKKQFLKFDYGTEKNKIVYGQPNPPSYDLSKIKVPQVFIVSRNDKQGTKQDAIVSYRQIEQQNQHGFFTVEHSRFGLADFIQAKDVDVLLHQQLIKSVKRLIPPI